MAYCPIAVVLELLAAASLPMAIESLPVACAPLVASPPIAIALLPLANVALLEVPPPPYPSAIVPLPVA
ncbi:RecX family transcriptional regulator [Burkholderia pseudomallei]|nr:regulatory protein RecX [Burkholderia pseudomallei 406e]EMP77275.1 hypothetical protein D512_10233 [Burkholderia pseudomallei MSHR1043]EQA89345.1 regulatory protein RecX [Burkholderia pseudomallei MSHR338]EXI97663.1 RecX family transcriptional regulator [Burkholderia pseudomallei MSHR6137]KNA35915.1 RecX family transcriptional regulator [Burkholderia pseudomallei]